MRLSFISKCLQKYAITTQIKACLMPLVCLTAIFISAHAAEEEDSPFIQDRSTSTIGQELCRHPDVLDVLVNIEVDRVAPDHTYISLRHTTRPIYAGKLDVFGHKTLKLVFDNLVRIGGIIQSTSLIPPGQVIYTHDFETINQSIILDDSTDALHLGGFWERGCEIESIRQYLVTFYEADGQIRFRLHPNILTRNLIRDGYATLRVIEENIKVGEVISEYQSLDIQLHGSSRAWITFRRIHPRIVPLPEPERPLPTKRYEREAEEAEAEEEESSEDVAEWSFDIIELDEPEDVSNLFYALAEEELRGRQRTITPHGPRSASYSPPRLRDTAYEKGVAKADSALSKLYQGRERLQEGEITCKTVARTIAAYGLDGVGWAVNKIDQESGGAVTWVNEKMDGGAQWTTTKVRRAVREMTGNQRLGQNLGDYIYVGLSVAGPKKLLVPVQAAAKATKAANAVEKVVKVNKKLGAAELAESLGVNVKGIKQPWTVRPGQEWKQRVFGKAQKTGTDGHAFRSYRIAIDGVKYDPQSIALLNRGLKRATGQSIPQRPDVTIIGKKPNTGKKPNKNAKVDQYEVPSKTDNDKALRHRMRMNQSKFPDDKKGKTKVEHITKGKEDGPAS